METRDFHVSQRTLVRVYHNVQALSIGTAIFKSRVGLEATLPHQIRFTLAEWKNLQTILPSLVQEATNIHRTIISGRHHPPILKELRHILSSRTMVNLSVTRSPTEGTYVFMFLGPFDRHETGDIIPDLLRGVNLTFEEIAALNETNKVIEKYIANQLSTTKVITLNGVGDVIRAQNYISTFFSDGLNRVRLLLEKPVSNAAAAAVASAQVRRANLDTIDEDDDNIEEDDNIEVDAPADATSPTLSQELPPRQTLESDGMTVASVSPPSS